MKHSSSYALQIQRLQSYLDRVGLEGLAPPGEVKIRGLTLYAKQGLSNKTYLLSIAVNDGPLETLILRLYTGGGKAAREFKLLRLLRPKNLPVPKVYAFNEDKSILGNPFMIMEMIKQTPPEDGQHLIDAAARSLAGIHAVKPSELGGILEVKGNYPQRELDSIKFLAAALVFSTLGPSASLVRCLRYVDPLRIKLSEGRPFLIHGDFNFDNVVYSGGKAYIVDWESAEVAEPTFDVAYVCNFLDFWERFEGKSDGELSESFLDAYKKYGGTIKELGLYRRLAALKLLVLLDALRSKNVFALVTGLHAKFKDPETERLIEDFRRYLLRVLEGCPSL